MAADSGIIRGGTGLASQTGFQGSHQPAAPNIGIATSGYMQVVPPRGLVLRVEAFDGNAVSAVATTTVTIPIPAVSLRVAKMLALELAMKGLKAWLHEGLKSLGCK